MKTIHFEMSIWNNPFHLLCVPGAHSAKYCLRARWHEFSVPNFDLNILVWQQNCMDFIRWHSDYISFPSRLFNLFCTCLQEARSLVSWVWNSPIVFLGRISNANHSVLQSVRSHRRTGAVEMWKYFRNDAQQIRNGTNYYIDLLYPPRNVRINNNENVQSSW